MLTFRELQLTQISLNFQNSCCNLKVRGLGEKLCMTFFCYFYFERNYDVLKSRSPYFSLKKNINFDINETELKIPHSDLERLTFCSACMKIAN